MKTIRMIVTGKVQGVFYRAYAKKTADQMNITGRIKNLPDRTVEIIATAEDEVLKKFIEWCRQGPPQAEVKEVFIENKPEEKFPDFRINK